MTHPFTSLGPRESAISWILTALVLILLLALGGSLVALRRLRARSSDDAQETLRISEEKFSKAFRAIPDAILITSVADGKIADLNEGFTRIAGWSRQEAIASPPPISTCGWSPQPAIS